MIQVGIDTGGTFTDFIMYSPNKGWQRWKIPSTPNDPSLAIIKGLSYLLSNEKIEDKIELVHGTTVGTNAFLEGKGAKTLLITTRNFEDVIFIGRQNRAKLYSLSLPPKRQIITPESILGVKERISYDGNIITELSEKELNRVCEWICKKKAASIAISLIHSYKNDIHEKKLFDKIRTKGLHISLSSKILREFREFERTSTTLINAYLAPVVGNYVNKLSSKLKNTTLLIQQSNGGCIPAKGVGELAITTLLSGPAGGVLAAHKLARTLGIKNIITLDMGGTSTDVSICPGELIHTRSYQIQGYPISIPMLDIHTIGAGGGSIAWIDKGGLLQVGPQSAGADPGPACYGKGELPTVTDANLFLGRLIPESFLNGRMKIYPERAYKAISSLSSKLKLSPVETALGILKIVNTNMVKAIREVSLEKGFDPRDFVLTCFGGAAGLHAASLAKELNIKKILLPSMGGVFSAKGMAEADIILESSMAILELAYKNADFLKEPFSYLKTQLNNQIKELKLLDRSISFEPFVDVRYKGQSFEITVPFNNFWEDAFYNEHKRLYGYNLTNLSIEVTAIRLRARIKRDFNTVVFNASSPHKKAPFVRKVINENGEQEVQCIFRETLSDSDSLKGPLLILDDFTTCYVPEGWVLMVKDSNIFLLKE